jgi:hypothetical protein
MQGRPLALLLAVAFIVACGGASTTGTAGASAGASAAAAATNPASVPGAGTPATAAPATAAGASQPKLTELLAAAKLTQYKITYKITASGAGAEAFSGEQSWFFKPPRSRFDFASNVGGQKTTISFFSLPEGSFYCFAAGGSTQCLAIAGVGSPLDQNIAASMQQSLIDHPDQYGGTFSSTKTIAGQQGLCYDVKAVAAATTGLSSGTFCYSKEGIALLSQFSASGSSWSMEATSVSTTVPDSDFTLPAKPLGR